MKKFVCLILILMLITSVSAVKHVPKLHEDIHQNMGFLSMIKYHIIKSLRVFTIVHGYICSDRPDDVVDCRWSYTGFCKVQCPTTVQGGCAVDLFDENYELMWEETLQPGEYLYICSECSGPHIAEVYYCNTPLIPIMLIGLIGLIGLYIAKRLMSS